MIPISFEVALIFLSLQSIVRTVRVIEGRAITAEMIKVTFKLNQRYPSSIRMDFFFFTEIERKKQYKIIFQP